MKGATAFKLQALAAPTSAEPGIEEPSPAAVRELSRGLLEDPEYQRRLRQRLISGGLAPAIEILLYHYAYGKPTDQPEHADSLSELLLLALREKPNS